MAPIVCIVAFACLLLQVTFAADTPSTWDLQPPARLLLASSPTFAPTRRPTKKPTFAPSKKPTKAPTAKPIKAPTKAPSKKPTKAPTKAPIKVPSKKPTKAPTRAPSKKPTRVPTKAPVKASTRVPTKVPTKALTAKPSKKPSTTPSKKSTVKPTLHLTKAPTAKPTLPLTKAPSKPSTTPTKQPVTTTTKQPSMTPTKQPSTTPTKQPITAPTNQPITTTTKQPSMTPTKQPSTTPTKQPTKRPTAKASFDMSETYFAQTHVIPPEGLSWYNGTVRLTLVGKREALFMFKLDDKVDGSVYAHVFGYDAGGQYVGAVPISPPNELPPVEANQTDLTFSTEHYSATLPAAWIVPYFGLAIGTQSTPAACCTTDRTIFSEVSSDNELDIYTLPTYLYGANETNSQPLEKTMSVPLKNQQEFWAKQPASKINFRPHPIGVLKFPWVVAGPTSTKPARLLTDRSQEEDGFYTMGIVLGFMSAFRDSNAHGNSQYYSAMQTLENGKSVGSGGGLGGGSRATGDAAWAGVFIHEVGHGMGLPHAGGAYPNSYPYQQGSLQYSKWGYDTLRKVFLPNTIPPTTTKYDSCKTSHLTTADSRCIKQDYMQSGSGDQAKGDIFTMASDYNAAKIQEYVDSRTFPDPKSSTGYSAWNKTGKYRFDVKPTMPSYGLYGLTNGIPIKTNVKVYTVIAPFSLTTVEVRRFYPLNNAYTGNLLRYIDPTNSTALDELRGKAMWYCRYSGCDYTFKMTYTDGSVIYQLHQGGFRKWFSNDFDDGVNDPFSGDSFRSFYMNFPGDKKASKVEFLDTPLVLTNGFPASPVVLMSYVYP